MLKINIFILSIVLFFSGCARYSQNSAFVKYYKPATDKKFKPSENIQYRDINNNYDVISTLKDGYGLLGTSDYSTAVNMDKKQLLEFGKSLGSNLILGTEKYLKTSSGIMPFTNYHSGNTYTVNTYGNSNTRMSGWNNRRTVAYGNSYGNYNSTSTITTPSYTTTQYLPYNRDVNEYHIYYFKKIDISNMSFGTTFKDITPNTRSILGNNKGCQVNYVYNNTPAFKSNIMDFDIILEINNKDIYSCDDFKRTYNSKGNNKLMIWRDNSIVYSYIDRSSNMIELSLDDIVIVD